MEGAEAIFGVCISMLKRLAEHGLIHCDFNEFNLMTNSQGVVTMIDFPQMVSTSHPNAIDLFKRDVNGLVKFFAMKMKYIPPEELIPQLEDIVLSERRLDEEVRACGKFSREDDEELIRYINFENDIQSAPTIAGSSGVEGEEYDEEDYDEDEQDGEVAHVFHASELCPIRPNRNTATYDHDFSCDVSSVSSRSGRDCLTSRADMRRVLDSEVGDDVAEEVVAHGVGSASNGEEDDSDDDLSCEEREDSERVSIHTSPIDRQQVKDNVKRDKSKHQGKAGRPNQTKGRTKYGKIDRSSRQEDWG